MKEIAQQFGKSLDQDDFTITMDLLAADCIYEMGAEILKGPKDITASYEQNMLAGRKKMDKLEWGESKIDMISENEYIVNFTDYLFHNGEQYTHRCQQRLLINSSQKITKIEHIQNDEEQHRLTSWYKSVGIPTS